MIQATGVADASYNIENISLEYDMVIQPELARMIANQYGGGGGGGGGALRSSTTGF